MISHCYQGKPFNITVIQVYTQSLMLKKLKLIVLWRPITPSRISMKRDVIFIIGNCNTKVRSQEIPRIIGKLCLRVQNEAGQRLTEFCQENMLAIANTLFQQPKGEPYILTSRNHQDWNQINYVLHSQKWRNSIQSAKARPGADCGLDHELLTVKFRFKLRKVWKIMKALK